MTRKIFCTLALVAALLLVFSGLAAAQSNNGQPVPPVTQTTLTQNGPAAPVGTEEPCIANPCLFYAGDFDQAGPNPNGLFNGNDNFFGLTIDATVWVPVNVPKKFKGAKGKTDWSVTGLFGNTQDLNNPTASATTGDWAIVQGVVQGSPVSSATVVCSANNSPMTTTPTGRIAFGFFVEYTNVITVSGCPVLEAGTYWIAAVPNDLTNSAGFQESFLSDVEDNTPHNAEGPGTEPVDQSFFTSRFFGFPNFTLANSAQVCGGIGCDAFSVGVIGTATH